MKLSLIFNPFSYKAHEENLKIVSEIFRIIPAVKPRLGRRYRGTGRTPGPIGLMPGL